MRIQPTHRLAIAAIAVTSTELTITVPLCLATLANKICIVLHVRIKTATCSLYAGDHSVHTIMVYGSLSCGLTPVDHGRHNEESTQVPTPDTSQLDDAYFVVCLGKHWWL